MGKQAPVLVRWPLSDVCAYKTLAYRHSYDHLGQICHSFLPVTSPWKQRGRVDRDGDDDHDADGDDNNCDRSIDKSDVMGNKAVMIFTAHAFACSYTCTQIVAAVHYHTLSSLTVFCSP